MDWQMLYVLAGIELNKLQWKRLFFPSGKISFESIKARLLEMKNGGYGANTGIWETVDDIQRQAKIT
jgi:hypothetical protein